MTPYFWTRFSNIEDQERGYSPSRFTRREPRPCAGKAVPEPIATADQEAMRSNLRDLVRRTVEDTLDGLLYREAEDLVGAGRYEGVTTWGGVWDIRAVRLEPIPNRAHVRERPGIARHGSGPDDGARREVRAAASGRTVDPAGRGRGHGADKPRPRSARARQRPEGGRPDKRDNG